MFLLLLDHLLFRIEVSYQRWQSCLSFLTNSLERCTIDTSSRIRPQQSCGWFPNLVKGSVSHHRVTLQKGSMISKKVSRFKGLHDLRKHLGHEVGSPQVLLIRGSFHEMSMFHVALSVPFARAQPLQRTSISKS